MKVTTKENRAILDLSIGELVLLNNALNEICHGPDAIEDWEFHSRTGSNKPEAESLLDQLSKLVDDLKRDFPSEYYGGPDQ
jgi:hypothetical protein